MMRLAINGFGRIGRCVLRALYEGDYRRHLQVVAINEPAELATIAHLIRYDSTHGRFPGEVALAEGGLLINGDHIAVSAQENIDQLHWPAVDLVLECSGVHPTAAALRRHLAQGARRVLLSQPGDHDIPVIVWGVNEQQLDLAQQIASSASCTSNGIVPVVALLDASFGIESGVITTIHSAMNDQPVIDAYHHTDLRKTRAAGQSVIPVDTGLAQGVARLLPALSGRLVARALRVPTTNVSAMELTVQVRNPVTTASVNKALRAASEGALKNILGYTEEPLASCDFNHDARSGIVDAGQTRVCGQQISVLVWFDNEWAYANRMLDVAARWLGVA